jgi:hypothetical protein
MEQQVTRSPAPIAGILAIGGGVLLALGSFLAWAEVSGGGTSVTASGIDGSDGWITLICGLLVLFAGVMLLRAGGRRAVAIVAVAAGLVGGGVGLYDALTAKDRVLDDAAEELAGQFGATAEAVRTILDEAIEAGELGISISIGLYMVIAGGALGVVGGILGMRRAPQQVAAPVTAPASPPVATPDTPAAQDPSSVAMAPDPSGMPAPPSVEDEAAQPPGP